MTQYAYDAARPALIAAWDTRSGRVTSTFAVAPESASSHRLLDLTEALGDLSKVAWRTYTHPAFVLSNLETGREEGQRQRQQESFTELVRGVRSPDPPEDDHTSDRCSPVIESGHRIERALRLIGDTRLSADVTAEVEAELAAVEQAEQGDLSGRAQQAVLLTRQEASPVQVAEADALLRDAPLGSMAMFSEIDPTAAAVAAAHWLQAAADVVADSSGRNPVTIVVEADKVEPVPYVSATRVLGSVNSGASPRQAVSGLVQDALNAADGEVPNVDELPAQVDKAEEVTCQHADRERALADEVRRMLITPVDPQCPARHLLDDLLSGIRACLLLLEEDAGISEESIDGEDDWYAEDVNELHDELRRAFIRRVRAETAAEHDRLTL